MPDVVANQVILPGVRFIHLDDVNSMALFKNEKDSERRLKALSPALNRDIAKHVNQCSHS
jgi:hypothetical protein